ncbi:MAG: isoaspartyl peptidase/L-asparaginase [Xanthomonadales bacterium]|nr:isoaspartyl peptidase/L-asparaginase [Xanthomonadales bacterium]
MSASPIRFALHGGAGVIDRASLDAEREADCHRQLRNIAEQARQALLADTSALDVVQQAVEALEDCPWFNAGHGSVLNADGVPELDAALMDGRDRRCGAVAALRGQRHPIRVARAVLDDGQHVLLAGDGATRFAIEQGLTAIDDATLITAERHAQWQRASASGRVSLDHDEAIESSDRCGTVGAVARDLHGHLAAATSTGGMTNKRPGRVGDTPLIGSGTWADDRTVCVSTTGTGEHFIRAQVAFLVHARMCFDGCTLATAATAALDEVAQLGGCGGLIAIAHDGQLVLPFNTPGMYRAWIDADGRLDTAIYAC